MGDQVATSVMQRAARGVPSRVRTATGLAAVAVFALAFLSSEEAGPGDRVQFDRIETAAPTIVRGSADRSPLPASSAASVETAASVENAVSVETAVSVESAAEIEAVRSIDHLGTGTASRPVASIDRLPTSTAQIASARFEVVAVEQPSTPAGTEAPDATEPTDASATASPLTPVAPISDRDGDGWSDRADNCPVVANPDQTDDDRDGIGDRCQVGGGLDPMSVALTRTAGLIVLTWNPAAGPDPVHHVVSVWPPAEPTSGEQAIEDTAIENPVESPTVGGLASDDPASGERTSPFGPAASKYVVDEPRIELPAELVGWIEIESIAGDGDWTNSTRLRLPDAPLTEVDVAVIDYCPPGSNESLVVPGSGPTCKPRLPDGPTPGDERDDRNPGPGCGQIDVEFERGEVRNQSGWEHTAVTAVDIECEPGSTGVAAGPRTYEIVLISSDPNHRPGYQTDQTDERWYLEGLDADGRVVYRSPSTADLADGLTSLREPVDVADLTGVVAVRAVHHGAGSGPNSIEVAAVLIPV